MKKNRVRQYSENIPSIEDLLKHIEENNKKILESHETEGTYTIGKMQIDENGDYDPDAPDIIDINRLKEFYDLTRKRGDFIKADMQTLIDLIPALERILTIASDDKGEQFNSSGFTIHFAEHISDIPSDYYFDLHHKDTSKDAETIKESLELGLMIINDFLPKIQNKTFKQAISYLIMETLFWLETHRESLQHNGLVMIYNDMGQYSDEELKQAEEVFQNRNSIKESLYRRDFIEDYIDNQVYERFFSDNETPYTPELGQAWDTRFNELCDEYQEQEYKRAFTEKDYQSVGCGKLCHYPISHNPAKSLQKALNTARHFGLNEGDIIEGFNFTYTTIKERPCPYDEEKE